MFKNYLTNGKFYDIVFTDKKENGQQNIENNFKKYQKDT